FYHNELQRALSEQGLAIQSFSITSSSSLQAAASVTLQEGDIITIQLTSQGYKSPRADRVFETIEELLQSVSSLYTQTKESLLMRALEKLQSSG
ncbi:hypothetical protein BDP27DRAFT_1226269, partial [Rhodocollybia butyracea]